MQTQTGFRAVGFYLVEVLLGERLAVLASDGDDLVEPVGELLVLLQEVVEGDGCLGGSRACVVTLRGQLILSRLQTNKQTRYFFMKWLSTKR